LNPFTVNGQLDDRKVFALLALRDTATNWPVTKLTLRPDFGGDCRYKRLCPVAARNPNARISRKVTFVTIVRNVPPATRIWCPAE
jgi:hypothetical protein